MQLRVARHTQRLDEIVAFYRDGIGLPEIGGFRGHRGYDGVFLALPGARSPSRVHGGRRSRRAGAEPRVPPCSTSATARRSTRMPRG